MLSQTVKDYIHAMLSIELADDPETISNVTHGGSKQYRDEIEAGLRELLSTREFSTRDWYRMTYADFDSEEELYAYLEKMYDYLFRDSQEFPDIPE